MSIKNSPAPCASVPRPVSVPVARRAAVGCITLYRLTVSPLLGPHCRFTPSCSAYTAEAITRYGLIPGLRRGLWRLVRCHPLHPGGIDPVE